MKQMNAITNKQAALLIVDLQNDFCPGGHLPVPKGDSVVPVINQYIQFFQKHNLPILASRDWHPAETSHFKDFGGLWPAHCVQHTEGAAFHQALQLPPQAIIVSKGMTPDQDGYSAFQAIDDNGIPLDDLLREQGITTVFVCGLATDYCVKASALDAVKQGYHTIALLDAMKGVNVKPEDSAQALQTMSQAGVLSLTWEELIKAEGNNAG